MRSQPLMLDVDTGVDDAAAIAMAVGMRANLVAISTVAGNTPIERSTENTLRVLALMGKVDVPVYRGASRPLVAPYRNAAYAHGDDGLGGVVLPASPASVADSTGPEAIIDMASRYSGELTLVTLGPLTNLAIALSLRPDIVRQIANVFVMGGAYEEAGNVTPHAEFNFYVDPDAAVQVFAAPWQAITVLGLDVTHQTIFPRAAWEAIPEGAAAAAGLMREVARHTFTERKLKGFYLHDPLAAAVALDPSLIEGRFGAIEVVTTGEERGKTAFRPGGNVLVATGVQAERFVRRFCDALGIHRP